MEGVRPCPYCGGEVEVIKLSKNADERQQKKPQPYRIQCYRCHAVVARGQGFPIESKSEANERIEQYNKYIEDLHGRSNGNGWTARHNHRSIKSQNS